MNAISVTLRTNFLKTIIAFVLTLLCLPSFSLSYKDRPFDNSDWHKIYEKHNITVYSHKPKNSALVVFKAVGVLGAPLSPILGNLREVEKTVEWAPNMTSKTLLKNFSDVEAITYNDNDLPWPATDRDLVLTNKLFLDEEEAYLIVETRSVDFPQAPSNKNRVRAVIEYGTMAFRPVDEKSTWVELIILVDPKGSIPKWLVNIMQQKMPYEFLKALEKRANEFAPEQLPGIADLEKKLKILMDKKMALQK